MPDAEKKPHVLIAERALEAKEEGDHAPRLEFLIQPLEEEGILPRNRELRWIHIRKYMKQARDYLERNWNGLHVCTVSEEFYLTVKNEEGKVIRESFYERSAETHEEAWSCLPGGGSSRIDGLYFAKDEHDLIFMASLSYAQNCGSRTITGVYQRTTNGVADGVLNGRKAFSRLREINALAVAEAQKETSQKLIAVAASLAESVDKLIKREESEQERSK